MVGRPVAFGADVRARAHALLDAGHTYSSVRSLLRSAGVDPPPSEGWLAMIRRQRSASAPAPDSAPPTPAPARLTPPPPPSPVDAPTRAHWEGLGPAPSAPARAPAPDLTGLSVEQRVLRALEYQVGELVTELARVGATGDTRAVGAVARSLTATLGELRKAAPPPPPDADALGTVPAVIMRRAADRARALLLDQLARVRAERETCARCPTCGGLDPRSHATR
jgi:hypothetical protein